MLTEKSIHVAHIKTNTTQIPDVSQKIACCDESARAGLVRQQQPERLWTGHLAQRRRCDEPVPSFFRALSSLVECGINRIVKRTGAAARLGRIWCELVSRAVAQQHDAHSIAWTHVDFVVFRQ